ncbi:hypothetical protein [Streptomyces sp. NPDC050504]|uniref:hypothetical protein n=1 Tax=Streptomyces sp. NPDC050504 TaxID=3365618 RepID=UPI00378C41DD
MTIHKRGARRRAAGGALGAAALLLTLAACGGGDGDGGGDGGGTKAATDGRGDVASIEKPAGKDAGKDAGKGTGKDGAPAPGRTRSDGTTSDEGRPQLRLDTSDEESNRLWQRYMRCLKDNGVEMLEINGGLAIADQYGKEPAAAYKKCEVKMPLQPPELDEDKNPRYREQWSAQVRCMQKRGMKIKEIPDGWTYTSSDGPGVPEAEQKTIERECQKEAFGG